MKWWCYILLWLCLYSPVKAGKVYDTLYLNRDTSSLCFSQHVFCSFNASPVFSTINKPIYHAVGDTLMLLVINSDTVDHDFTIDGFITSSNLVPQNDSTQFQLHITSQGSYRYYSSLNNAFQLGASGILQVGYTSYKRYTWNLFDQDSAFSVAFNNATITTIDTAFHPNVFMINGLCYPQTEADSTTLITGMVGDSIVIGIVNSGHMYHSIHFHGYHLQIVSAIPNTSYLGRSKDSFPLAPGEALTLLLVPDKDGMYPVHDHNLIAVTNDGGYPGGMMTMIDIMP